MAQDQNETRLEVDEELLDDLHELIELRDEGALRAMLIDLHAADIAQLLQFLDEEERHHVLRLLDDEVAGEVMLHLPDEQRGEYLAELAPHEISDIVEELEPDDAADIVSELSEDLAEEVLQNLQRTDLEATEEIRDLLRYAEDTAGGRMTTDFVAAHVDETIAASIEKIREFVRDTELEVHALYVVDDRERLVGMVRLQDLVLRSPVSRVGSFMEEDLVTVGPNEDQALVAQVMQRYDLIDVPVLDDAGVLLGIVTFDDIADIIEDEASEDMLYLAGVTEDESPTTPPLVAIRRRLPWLVINLGTAFVASLVVAQFQDTIGKVPKLAALMPIVAGMGGNAAIQTITVMVRGFALGEIGAGRSGRATTKEALVGLMNGLSLGMLAGVIVWMLYGRADLGALITVAMLANLLMAGVAGALIPIILRKLKFDPALSSGPIVTTFTDITGFFTFLGLATATLTWLLRK
jgi:magnesium transporter